MDLNDNITVALPLGVLISILFPCSVEMTVKDCRNRYSKPLFRLYEALKKLSFIRKLVRSSIFCVSFRAANGSSDIFIAVSFSAARVSSGTFILSSSTAKQRDDEALTF